MKLKSTLIVSAALLFVSAPAWADSVKPNALGSASGASSFSRSDIKRLGGFKMQGRRLIQGDVEPDGDSDDPAVPTPEPGSRRYCSPVCYASVHLLEHLPTAAISLLPAYKHPTSSHLVQCRPGFTSGEVFFAHAFVAVARLIRWS